MKKYRLLLAIIFIISCEPEPYDAQLNFTIHNNSKYMVELGIFKSKFSNSPIRDTSFTIGSGSELNYTFYNKSGQEPFGMSSDSAYITFDNIRRLIYKREDNQIKNILDVNSWKVDTVNDHTYEFEYFITDEDYENAVLIE